MTTLLDLLCPRRCVSCGQLGDYFCPVCRSHLVVKSVHSSSTPPLDGRLSLFAYTGPLKTLIHDLKFNFVSDSVPCLASLISNTLHHYFPHLLHYWQSNSYQFLPLPLHPRRQNWRGFNQSRLIADHLSPLLGLSVVDILARSKNTLPQSQLGDKRLRPTNLQNAFVLKNEVVLNVKSTNDKYIILDDVYTTGSTIRSAISALPSTSSVWVLTLAG